MRRTTALKFMASALFALMVGGQELRAEASPPPPTIASGEDAQLWKLAAREYGVDVIDLYAIAFKESRRRRADGAWRPWPWTLNSPQTGALYFDSYEAALAKLKSLIESGETNIDIGLTGINWRWNGHRASDYASLLKPATNIPVAAKIYREHLDACGGDRREAIARYHSSRIELGVPYAAAVISIAEDLRSVPGVQLALAE